MTRLSARLSTGLAAAIAITTLAAPASAQCEPEWRSLRGGVAGFALAMTEFDDGSGPALYVGGQFETAGGVRVHNVARWDGWTWSPVGDEIGRSVYDFAVFDDGSGPALYAAAWLDVPAVVRWDGESWTKVGMEHASGTVRRLAVFDDGTGPALYAGGTFTAIDGERRRKIARWDGSSWSAVGSDGVDGDVLAMTVFDDGGGPALYVGGNMFTASGVEARHVARWDGKEWSGLGHEAVQRTRNFYSLAVFDDGSGPALYGGAFLYESGTITVGGGVLRWNGEIWVEVGGQFNATANSLGVFDDGSGPALYAGGSFTQLDGEPVRHLVRWDGSSWSTFEGGTSGLVVTIGSFDEGAGPTLFVGGGIEEAGGVDVLGIAAFGCPPPACYGDCDDNGALDIFDYLCYQNLFADADPGADCDESGILDFADFLCFQNAFAAGCP